MECQSSAAERGDLSSNIKTTHFALLQTHKTLSSFKTHDLVSDTQHKHTPRFCLTHFTQLSFFFILGKWLLSTLVNPRRVFETVSVIVEDNGKMVDSGGTGGNEEMSSEKKQEKARAIALCATKKKSEGSPVSVSNPVSAVPLQTCAKSSEHDPVEAMVAQPEEESKTGADEGRDWDDPVACELEKLLLSYIQAIFQCAIKRITDRGYSEEVAVKAVSRGGIYIGGKNSVSNIVNKALEFLKGGKNTDIFRENELDTLQHIVEYTMLEMICVLREVRPTLTVAEAMWWLLICDLNVLHACTMEGDLSSVLASEESSTESSSDSSSLHLQSEADNTSKPSLTDSQSHISLSETKKLETLLNSANTEQPEGKDDIFSSMLDGLERCLQPTRENVQSSSQISTSEEKSGVGKKGRTKAELAALRKKTLQVDRNNRVCRPKGSYRSGKFSALNSIFTDKRTKSPSNHPGAGTTYSSSKVTVSGVTSNPSTSPASFTTVHSTVTITSFSSVDTEQKPKSDSEEKSETKIPVCTSVPPKTVDYCAGIPYDKTSRKYVPQDMKDKQILKLVSEVHKLENALQSWTDWTTQRVMQVSRRLGKDQAELKALRREKEEVGNFEKEKQIVEENTMKRLAEMEQALKSSSSQIRGANSTTSKLQQINSTLKKQLSSAKNLSTDSAAKREEALEREKTAIRKVQACDREKSLLKEELETEKNNLAVLQQDIGKTKTTRQQVEARLKQVVREKETILAQTTSMRNEREQREAATLVEEAKMKHKANDDRQKCVEEIKSLKSKVSELQTESDSSRIAALRRDTTGSFGAGLADKNGVMTNQSSTVSEKLINSCGTETILRHRECVMCLSEEMSVVFLPCAHQVLCEACNELHLNEGMKDCPSCRAIIHQRIKVKYASS